MSIRVTVTRQGGGIRGLQDALTNVEPAMKAIAQLLEAEVRQSFETETSPSGAPWAPLSPVTLRLKARGGMGGQGLAFSGAQLSGNKILRGNTGALLGGIMPRHTKTTASVGPTGPATRYAGVHQFGNPDNKMPGGHRAPIPARPFLPVRKVGGKIVADVPEEVLAEIRAILTAHLRSDRPR